jgi:hypothetical protein
MTLLDQHKNKNIKHWRPLDFFGFYLTEHELITGSGAYPYINKDELTQALSQLRRQIRGTSKNAIIRNYISYAIHETYKNSRSSEFMDLFTGHDAKKLKKNFMVKEEGSG